MEEHVYHEVGNIAERVTCNNNTIVLKTEAKTGTEYENSPLYRGKNLWNSLSKYIKNSIFTFKTPVSKLCKVFKQ